MVVLGSAMLFCNTKSLLVAIPTVRLLGLLAVAIAVVVSTALSPCLHSVDKEDKQHR